jgi:fructokinase
MPSSSHHKIMVPGTVLLDIYVGDHTRCLGGAEFNFAYHVHKLTGDVDFIGRVGRDEAGDFIFSELGRRGFPVHLIQTDPSKPTKTVRIFKDARNEPVYLIADDVSAEYLDEPPLSPADVANYDLLYFGTTLQHGAQSRATLRGLLAAGRGLKFCDLNLRTGKYTPETIDFSLYACTVLKLNHEELRIVAAQYGLTGQDREQVAAVSQRFGIPVVCLTLAAQGSMLYQDGAFSSHVPAPCPVKDTVGAGDGFSACLAIGLLRAWEAERLLAFASRFAAAICGITGAVPAEDGFYQGFIDELR